MQRIKQLVSRHKIAAALAGIIGVAFALVFISMTIYYRSGAFQLDLSRPEYKSLRSQIDTDTKTTDTFEAQGEINEEVLDDFLARYKDKSARALEAKAFSTDVLSDQQLGLTE